MINRINNVFFFDNRGYTRAFFLIARHEYINLKKQEREESYVHDWTFQTQKVASIRKHRRLITAGEGAGPSFINCRAITNRTISTKLN